MIYDCQNAVVDMVGVEHMTWKAGVFRVEERDYSALAFRIKGDARITAGDREYRVGTGDVLYLPQNCSYTADYSDTEIIVIHFRTAQNDTWLQVFPAADPERMYRAFLKAYTLWNGGSPARRAYALAQLYDILGQVGEREAAEERPEPFLRALAYINANFRDSSLCIGDICRQTGLCATSLRGYFERFCGKKPVQYIAELRLEHARGLISCGASVREAAEESGFNDPKYFARVVKKYLGCTPRELALFGK